MPANPAVAADGYAAAERRPVGRRGLTHVDISTNKKVPAPGGQLITYSTRPNFKLPDS
jgi:hypothetical protein